MNHQNEMALFSIFASFFWPILRPFLGRVVSRRCRVCLLSENYASLSNEGGCAVCAKPELIDESDKMQDSDRWKEMNRLLAGSQLSGPQDFDALVLFSGGKDSSYVLHEITTRYPDLRILALTVDNYFLSPVAKENSERIARELDVTHCCIRPPWSIVKNLFRHTLTHTSREDHYPPTDLLDGHLTFVSGYHLARQMKIPLVIAGISKTQGESVLSLDSYRFSVDDLLKNMPANIKFSEIFEDLDLRFWESAQEPDADGPIFVNPLYVWNLSEEEITKEVENLGFLNRRNSNPLVTNNELIPVASAVEIIKYGFTKFEIEFAKGIRKGKSERKFWLNIFEMLEWSVRTGWFLPKSFDHVLKKLDLSKSEIGMRG